MFIEILYRNRLRKRLHLINPQKQSYSYKKLTITLFP